MSVGLLFDGLFRSISGNVTMLWRC